MGRPKGSKNRPKEALQSTLEQPNELGVIHAPKRAQKARKGAKKASCGDGHPHGGQPCDKPKGHDGLHDSAAPQEVAKPTQFQKTSTQENLQPQRVIVDLTTGGTIGNAGPDFKEVPDILYSHSFVKDIHSCTAKAYFRKTKAPSRKVFALERGTVAHILIEGWEKEDKDPVAGLPDAWKHYILDNKDEFSPEDQEKIEKGFTDTQRMLAEFVAENEEIKHRIRPEDVEVGFKQLVTINTSAGPIQRWIVGKVDLVLWDEKRESYGIIDWKTSAKAPHSSELEIGVQFALYQMSMTEMFGQPPRYMTFYLLNGEHICRDDKGTAIRFSSVKHPRELGSRAPGCQINYALRVPKKTPEELQSLIDDYFASAVWKWEAGIVGKDGKHDPRNACSFCQYKEFCDGFNVKDLPAPVFVR